MSYAIEILDQQRAELVGFEECGEYDAFRYMWSEGNFACDCNRGLFWARAQGADPDWKDFPCGPLNGPGRFAVRITDLNTGDIVIDEIGG